MTNPPIQVKLLNKKKVTGLQPFLMNRDPMPLRDARKKRPLSNATHGKKRVKLNQTAVRNIEKAKELCRDKPSSLQVVVDLGAGKQFGRVTEDYVPTLLAGRCASRSYYLLKDCLSRFSFSTKLLMKRLKVLHFNFKLLKRFTARRNARCLSLSLGTFRVKKIGDVSWGLLNIPDSKRGHMIGNAMTTPVLMEAIRAVLVSARLATEER